MKTKKCVSCNEEKDINEFYKTKKRTHSYCKECFNTICKKRWIDRKLKVLELMGDKCKLCGYNKCVGALELHHLIPEEKDFDWNQMRYLKWENLIKELKKCVLLCSNCHRETHYNLEHKYEKTDNKLLNRVEIIATGKCANKECNNDVYGTKCCSVYCARIISRKVKQRPSKEKLKELIENYSMVKIGEMFNVSDNAIRKWAKQYEIL